MATVTLGLAALAPASKPFAYFDRRDLETEHLAELVGLGHQAREVAGEVARLVLGEDQAGEVLAVTVLAS